MLKYPGRRLQLLENLRRLSDRNYQREVWVNQFNDWKSKRVPARVYDSFDEQVHFFFDDTALAADPRSEIGLALNDEPEAQAIADLVHAIEIVLERGGLSLTDEEYIVMPEWNDVTAKAISAFALLSANNAL